MMGTRSKPENCRSAVADKELVALVCAGSEGSLRGPRELYQGCSRKEVELKVSCGSGALE